MARYAGPDRLSGDIERLQEPTIDGLRETVKSLRMLRYLTQYKQRQAGHKKSVGV